MDILEWENTLKPCILSNIELVKSYLNKGDTLIDVGANSGLFTKMIVDDLGLDYCENIVMFEPVPYLVNECRNKFENVPNIKIEQFAVSDKNEQTVIFASNQNLGYNKIYKDGMEIHSHEKYVINCVVFSDWIKTTNLTKVDFVKIDAEGHDINVIYGMFDWMKTTKNRPKILFEIGWYPDLEQKLINDVCDTFNYSVIKLERDTLLIP